MDELDALFAHRTGSGFPAGFLAHSLPGLLKHAPALVPAQRFACLRALRTLWREQGEGLPHAALRDLLALTAHWRDWPLADAVGVRLCSAGAQGTQDTLHLIDACRALGKADAALALCAFLRLGDPGNARHEDLHADLLSWRDWRLGFASVHDRDGAAGLALEPLAHHHARDFAWQYADPAIARLCCLPAFVDELDWHYWLADVRRAGGRLPYAVLHREWGFIGCVSLALHGDVGFFYYWLGRDFQGRGHGPRAGELLLTLARQAHGLRCCYAKVYDHNLRSRRGLEKMGFADLGMRGAGEDCNQLFYRRGPARARRDLARELHWLLERMDAQVRAAPIEPETALPA